MSNCPKYLRIGWLLCLNGHLQLRNVSVDSSFDRLLTVSEDAGYSHQASKPFDRIAVLAYNGRDEQLTCDDTWAKAVTLFDDMISKDGGMRDDPPRRFYPARLSG